MFYDAVPIEHELITSVGLTTLKTKGNMVIPRNEYIRTMSHK